MIVNNIPSSTVVQMATFQFGFRQSQNGHFATVATALSAPESGRSFEMVLASRYAWLECA
jgi:hypothetical protein